MTERSGRERKLPDFYAARGEKPEFYVPLYVSGLNIDTNIDF